MEERNRTKKARQNTRQNMQETMIVRTRRRQETRTEVINDNATLSNVIALPFPSLPNLPAQTLEATADQVSCGCKYLHIFWTK